MFIRQFKSGWFFRSGIFFETIRVVDEGDRTRKGGGGGGGGEGNGFSLFGRSEIRHNILLLYYYFAFVLKFMADTILEF